MTEMSSINSCCDDVTVVEVSVIIPTLYREESLLRCLSYLSTCDDCERMEVIVVDQTPPASWRPITPDISKRFQRFQRVYSPEPNLPAARNRGVRFTNAEILLFLDDDVEIEKSYVKNLVQILRNESADVVGGYAVTSFDLSMKTEQIVENVAWLEGTNVAIRRNWFLTIKGYDENLPYNEDAEFCHRARMHGLRISRHGTLKVIHYREPSGGIRHHPSVFWSARRMMRSDLYFIRAVGGGFREIISRAFATTWRESRGFARLRVGTTQMRLLACILAVPLAFAYAFRRPRLFRP